MTAQIVSLHCVLKNKFGRVLSVSFSRDVLTLDESPDAPLKGLTRGLHDIQRGEKRRIFVPADLAYGYYDLKKVMQRPLEDFEQRPVIGEMIRWRGGSAEYRVTEIKADTVTLDGNHPLAGQDLIFEVEALETRPATEEDLGGSDSISPQILFH